MIRLVTQFDQPSARPAVATPTCCGGCCSCCCCCIVTTTVVSVYSSYSAQQIHRETKRTAPERAWPSPWPALLSFFALPLGLFAIFLIGSAGAADIGAAFVVPIVWLLALGFAYTGAGAQRPWSRSFAVVGVGVAALVVEFFLWFAAVDTTIE